MKLMLCYLTTVFLFACTSQENSNLPDEEKFETQTDLMVNICNKFAEEPDAAKLHSAAVGVQNARVISCFDFNGECVLYGKCLAFAISASAEGSVSVESRGELRKKVSELKDVIREAKIKLRSELEKRK